MRRILTFWHVLSCMLLCSTSHSQPPAEPESRQDPEPLVVLRVGTIHPISGPAISPGVLILAGDRIKTVGREGEVELPADAEIFDYPTAHAYPGLIDALTTAYADEEVVNDAATNAGSSTILGLDGSRPEAQAMAASGITTAYIANRAETLWRGVGALVRVQKQGYAPLPSRPGSDTSAVELRLTSGAAPQHAIDRQKIIRTVHDAFEALTAYEQSQKDHDKATKEYEQKFQEYLEAQRKKNGRGPNEGAASRPSSAPSSAPQTRPAPSSQPTSAPGAGAPGTGAGPESRPADSEGRRGPRRTPGQGNPAQNPSGTPPVGDSAPTGTGTEARSRAAGPEAAGAGTNEIKRPTFPKPPAKDPAKEVLLMVNQGKASLRVEAHRLDEIRSTLALAKARSLPRVVLTGASQSESLANEIAAAGVPVITTPILPEAEPLPHLEGVSGTLPGKLQQAGVSVAIASGSARDSRYLPLLAAFAVGKGMDADQALRAITLTPAEILGLGKQMGSLQPGKLADVVLSTQPLLQSNARIFKVISAGQTTFALPGVR